MPVLLSGAATVLYSMFVTPGTGIAVAVPASSINEVGPRDIYCGFAQRYFAVLDGQYNPVVDIALMQCRRIGATLLAPMLQIASA